MSSNLPFIHTIQKGDTLFSIARRYHDLSLTELVDANRDLLTQGKSTPLVIGWVLLIPNLQPAPPPPLLVTIRKGDTLFSLARRYADVTLDQLIKANRHLLTNGGQTELEIGWQLRIPTQTQPRVEPMTPASPAPPVQAIPTRSRAMSAQEQVIQHIRQFDGYIQEASQKFGISVEKIRAIIATESRGKPEASSGNAFGLMQLTPLTWQDTQGRINELRPYNFTEQNWKTPRLNILCGTAAFKIKLQAVKVDPNDDGAAEIAIVAYNAGQGTVRRALENARAGGSPNPTADFLKPQYMKPAIRSAGIYKYYLEGRGNRKNPYMNGQQAYHAGAALNAAVDLKYKEITIYPDRVRQYLAVQ
jgi:LysM repeat protein